MFFEHNFESGIGIPFIWDISELSIWYIGKIIDEKEVLSSQDFFDRTAYKIEKVEEISVEETIKIKYFIK